MNEPAAPISAISWIHLTIRFLLEVAGWVGLGMLGWHLGEGGFVGIVLALIFVAVAMALWGIFRTPGDTSGGKEIIATPGQVRFLIEFVVLAGGALGIWLGWSRAASETFMTLTVLHYAVTWERTWWLLTGRSRQSSKAEGQ